MSDIYQKIVDIFREVMDFPKDEEINAEATFKELGIDSMDLVEVVFAIEEEFGIEIPDENLKSFESVGSAIQYVENLL